MTRCRIWVAIFALILASQAQADFLSSITNGITSAANTVSNGLGTAGNAVTNGVGTAVNATSNGLSIATNATANGLNIAVNRTGNFVNTAMGDIKDAYNVSEGTVSNFTSSVRNAVSPAASTVGNTVNSLGDSVYNVTTGTYKGIVNYNNSPSAPSGASPAAAPPPSVSTEVDATSAASILATITANSSSYVAVANSFLVALGQNKSAAVETGIRNIVNNQTGNTSYPSTSINNTISMGLAEAIVTSLVTAQNYTVTVNANGTTNTVNTTQVVNVFLAGLQDGVTPCARNITSTSNTTAGSNAYFENISTKCCFLVAQPLTYALTLAQSNGAGTAFTDGLSRSQLLGMSPSLDLTRCLTNQTSSTQ